MPSRHRKLSGKKMLTNDDIHVVPVNDLREHDTDFHCWCDPSYQDGVWVHNSMDGREQFESGERKPS